MLAFFTNYYGPGLRAKQSVELFCAYDVRDALALMISGEHIKIKL